MKNVYFKKVTDFDNTQLITQSTYQMLKELIQNEKVILPKVMPLKVHFGEKGNTTFIKPPNFEGVKKFLREHKIKTCYIETNVLYRGSRTYTKNHIQTAREHGFVDLDIVIADGDLDSPYNEVEINKKHFSKCKIGKRFEEFDGFMVLAHFKGHGLAGFGGAIKQLGMGFASRGGKLAQHSDNVPFVAKDKCISCGVCVRKCPTNAIKLNDCAKIDSKLCVGCASCSTACPRNAIKNDWSGSNFVEKLAEYAYAASLGKNNIYVTFAGNITEQCDCCGEHMKNIADNIGIFVSTDPVAIDMAVMDMLGENEATKSFGIGRQILNYAQSIGLGTTKYNLCICANEMIIEE